MYQKPKSAKRLHFDVIPRAVDEYFQNLEAFFGQTDKDRLANPVWHIHGPKPEKIEMPFSFTMLLNLVSASSSSTEEQLWSFIMKYNPKLNKTDNQKLASIVDFL